MKCTRMREVGRSQVEGKWLEGTCVTEGRRMGGRSELGEKNKEREKQGRKKEVSGKEERREVIMCDSD